MLGRHLPSTDGLLARQCDVFSTVPGRVGSVTNAASRGVQNQIVASAETLGRVGGKFGRVGGEFGRVGEITFTRAEVVSLPMQPNNFEFGRVGVISRMTLRRMLLIL